MEETSSQLHSNAPSWQDIKHVPATTEQEDLTNQANRLFGERQAFQPAAPEGPSKQRQGVLIEGNIGDVVYASTREEAIHAAMKREINRPSDPDAASREEEARRRASERAAERETRFASQDAERARGGSERAAQQRADNDKRAAENLEVSIRDKMETPDVSIRSSLGGDTKGMLEERYQAQMKRIESERLSRQEKRTSGMNQEPEPQERLVPEETEAERPRVKQAAKERMEASLGTAKRRANWQQEGKQEVTRRGTQSSASPDMLMSPPQRQETTREPLEATEAARAGSKGKHIEGMRARAAERAQGEATSVAAASERSGQVEESDSLQERLDALDRTRSPHVRVGSETETSIQAPASFSPPPYAERQGGGNEAPESHEPQLSPRALALKNEMEAALSPGALAWRAEMAASRQRSVENDRAQKQQYVVDTRMEAVRETAIRRRKQEELRAVRAAEENRQEKLRSKAEMEYKEKYNVQEERSTVAAKQRLIEEYNANQMTYEKEDQETLASASRLFPKGNPVPAAIMTPRSSIPTSFKLISPESYPAGQSELATLDPDPPLEQDDDRGFKNLSSSWRRDMPELAPGSSRIMPPSPRRRIAYLDAETMEDEAKAKRTPRTMDRIAKLHERISMLPNMNEAEGGAPPRLANPSRHESPRLFESERGPVVSKRGGVPPLPLHTINRPDPVSPPMQQEIEETKPAETWGRSTVPAFGQRGVPMLPLHTLTKAAADPMEAMGNALTSVNDALSTSPGRSTDRSVSSSLRDSISPIKRMPLESAPRQGGGDERVLENAMTTSMIQAGHVSPGSHTPREVASSLPQTNSPAVRAAHEHDMAAVSPPTTTWSPQRGGLSPPLRSQSGSPSDKSVVRSTSGSPASVEIAVVAQQVQNQIDHLNEREERLAKEAYNIPNYHVPLDNPYLPDQLKKDLSERLVEARLPNTLPPGGACALGALGALVKDLPDTRVVSGSLSDLVAAGRGRYQSTVTTPRSSRVTTPRGSRVVTPRGIIPETKLPDTEAPPPRVEGERGVPAVAMASPRLGMKLAKAIDLSETSKFSFEAALHDPTVMALIPQPALYHRSPSSSPSPSNSQPAIQEPPLLEEGAACINDPSCYRRDRLGLDQTGRNQTQSQQANWRCPPHAADGARWEASSRVMLGVLDLFETLRGSMRGLILEGVPEFGVTGVDFDEGLLDHRGRQEWLAELRRQGTCSSVEVQVADGFKVEDHRAWCQPWRCLAAGSEIGAAGVLSYQGEVFRWRGARFLNKGRGEELGGSIEWQDQHGGSTLFSLASQELWLHIAPGTPATTVERQVSRIARVLQAFSCGNGSSRSREQRLFEVAQQQIEGAITLVFCSIFTDGSQELIRQRKVKGILVVHEEEGRKAVGRHEQETGFWLSLDGSPSESLSLSPIQKLIRSPGPAVAYSPGQASTPTAGSTPQGKTPSRNWSSQGGSPAGRGYARGSASRSHSAMASLSLSKSPEPSQDVTGTALDPNFSMRRAPRRSPPRQA